MTPVQILHGRVYYPQAAKRQRKELPMNTNWNDPNFQGFAHQPRPKKERKPVGTPLTRPFSLLSSSILA